MNRLLYVVATVLLSAAQYAHSAISFQFHPAYGPNMTVPNSSAYSINAKNAILNGQTKAGGDRSQMGFAYEQIGNTEVKTYEMVDSGDQSGYYNSYFGRVLPSQYLTSNVNNQRGNDIFFGMHFHAEPGDGMTFENVRNYRLQITDTIGGVFADDSTPLINATRYSANVIGIMADGSTATNLSDPVVDIIYIGPSKAFDVYDYGEPGWTNEQKMERGLAAINDLGRWSFTATASLGSMSQTKTIQVVPSVYVPEPAMLGLMAVAGALLLKRR